MYHLQELLSLKVISSKLKIQLLIRDFGIPNTVSAKVIERVEYYRSNIVVSKSNFSHATLLNTLNTFSNQNCDVIKIGYCKIITIKP